jgi:hypothetical protein
MRVKMLMDYQGDLSANTHFWRKDEEWELPDGIGAALIEEGRAVRVERPAVSLSAVFNGAIAQALLKAGYDSLEKVRAASDEDLLKIQGLGKKGLQFVRERQGG